MADGLQSKIGAYMEKILNWINGSEHEAVYSEFIDKINPDNEELLYKVTNSTKSDVDFAVDVALRAFQKWSTLSPIFRGGLIKKMSFLMQENLMELADCIARETGKPPNDAIGEVNAAILQADFFSSEGMRLFGKSFTSSTPDKSSHTVRQPLGVAGLIVPYNTPIANIAWKVFPALICGNSIVLKASEESPKIALLFAKLAQNAGVPDGVINIVQGLGNVAGSALVENKNISVISFTGSTKVGQEILCKTSNRLTRVSLELGGKNAILVCDDANLNEAVKWSVLSSFSNAGQRCAAASRFFVFESIYDEFLTLFVKKTNELKLGIDDDCDLGPVISRMHQKKVLEFIRKTISDGGSLLCGGDAPKDKPNGFYVQPTIINSVNNSSEINRVEIFGPVATVMPVTSVNEAISLVNDSEYGLTAAIHTTNIDRAMHFAKSVRTGVVNINFGTYGSEPHMPFGGLKLSGNGTREPGAEALEVYSELKNISILTRRDLV